MKLKLFNNTYVVIFSFIFSVNGICFAQDSGNRKYPWEPKQMHPLVGSVQINEAWLACKTDSECGAVGVSCGGGCDEMKAINNSYIQIYQKYQHEKCWGDQKGTYATTKCIEGPHDISCKNGICNYRPKKFKKLKNKSEV